MKRLLFHEMLVMSQLERKARKLVFHPKKTILKGQNDTGKSSLLKSLFWTFGAEPRHVHPAWQAASVTAAMRFSVDDTEYWILRDQRRFTLFDHEARPIAAYSSVTKGLGPRFAKLFNFPLQLSGRGDSGEGQATPAFLFLPFYFDQDQSWAENWSGFERLGQFASWRSDVVHFHTGVKPAEYYLAKITRARAQKESARIVGEVDVIRTVQDRLEEELPVAQFDVDVEVFRSEVDELLLRTATLQREEERLRSKAVAAHNQRESLLQQQAVVKAAVLELDRDLEFATKELGDEVRCPTCGTTHYNSFLERFQIARDEDTCRELLTSLDRQLEVVETTLDDVQEEIAATIAASVHVRELLARKRGAITLQQVVEAESKKHVRGILRADIERLSTSKGDADARVKHAKRRMQQFADKGRHAEIRTFYIEKMREFLHRLNVLKLDPQSYSDLASKIEESGSDQPRALLAYYFAILHTIGNFGTGTFCPIVIDSPNQQDQDAENWRRIMEFIVRYQPEGSQLIMGLVDEEGTDLGGITVTLTEKYSVLRREEFDSVAAVVMNLRERSFQVRESS